MWSYPFDNQNVENRNQRRLLLAVMNQISFWILLHSLKREKKASRAATDDAVCVCVWGKKWFYFWGLIKCKRV